MYLSPRFERRSLQWKQNRLNESLPNGIEVAHRIAKTKVPVASAEENPFILSPVNWLAGCFWFNDPLRQYFSLYQAISQGEREN